METVTENQGASSFDNALQFVKQGQTTTPINPRLNSQIGNPKQVQAPSTLDTVNSVADYMKGAGSWADDRLAYARPFTYGAGERNMNFDRYYLHPGFKKLGFDPKVDNEAVYNSNTSTWADVGRMLPQMQNLMNLGFSSMVNPFSDEQKDAEAYSRAVSLGTSSREGLGAWTSNLGLNAGYTMGIIAEAAAEEVALAAATVGSAGTASELTLPAMGAEAALAGQKIWKGFEMLKSIKQTFDAVKTAGDARKLWELAKTGTKSVAKWLNPLENTVDFTRDALRGLNGVDKLTTYAKVHKGVGSLVRDLREIKAVYSEANLEGGMVENDMNDKLIHDFYNKNGRLPNDQESQEIYQSAKDAARSTTWANVPLIYLSNKIVLDNAMKGFKPLNKMFSNEAVDLGKTITKVEGKYAVVNTFSKEGMKAAFKPYNLLKGSLRYSTANLAEGLQESSQEAVSSAFKDYYDPKYKDARLAGSHSLSDSFSKGMGEQFSKQGWDTFASGFFMGGLVQGPQKVLFQKVPQAYNKIFNATEYGTYKKQREDYVNSVVTAMNDVVDKKGSYLNYLQTNFADQDRAQGELRTTEAEGDVKAHKDAQEESLFNHMWTLLSTGREQVLIDELKGMKDLTPAELAEAFGREDAKGDLNNKDVQNKLQSLEDKVAGLKIRYEQAKDLKNPFDASRIDKTKEPERYKEELSKQAAFDFYKKQAVFSKYTFDRTLERMSSIIGDVGGEEGRPLAKAPLGDFTLLFDRNAMKQEMTALQSEISALNQSEGRGVKPELRKKRERLDLLNKLSGGIGSYMTALNLRSQAQVKAEAMTVAQKMSVMREGTMVKTKDGRKLYVKQTLGDLERVKLNDGKTYRVKNLTLTEDVKGEFNMDDFIFDQLKELKGSYGEWVRHIAGLNNDHVLDERVDGSFEKLKDYYALSHDSFKMASAINFLSNPDHVGTIIDRYSQAHRDLEARREKLLREGLDTFMKRMEYNDLLNALYKVGVFFEPSKIEAFLNDNVIPDTFYSATGLGVIGKDSPKYKEVEVVLEKFNVIVRPEMAIKTQDTTVDGVDIVSIPEGSIKRPEGMEVAQLPDKIINEAEGTVAEIHINYPALQGTLLSVNGSFLFRAMQSRIFVLAKVGNIHVPFYISSGGTSGKNQGEWYPFFGYTGNWLVKGGVENSTGRMNYSREIDQVAALLNKNFNIPERYINIGGKIEYKDEQGNPKVFDFYENIVKPEAFDYRTDGWVYKNGQRTNRKVEQDWVAQRTGYDPENVINDGGSSVENWISAIITAVEGKTSQSPEGTPASVTTEQKTKEALATVSYDVRAKLDKVRNGNELAVLENELLGKLSNFNETKRHGLSSDVIGTLVESKKRELASVLDPNSIKEGNVVEMQDPRYGRMVVLKSVNSNEIRLQKLGESTGTVLRVRKKDIQKNIKYMYTDDVTNLPEEELNDQDRSNAQTNKDNNVDFMSDAAQLKRLQDQAKSDGKEKVDTEFFNNLGCK